MEPSSSRRWSPNAEWPKSRRGGVGAGMGGRGGFMGVLAVQSISYGLAGANPGMWGLYLSIGLYGIAAWSIPTIMTDAVGDYLRPPRAAAGFSIITFFFGAGQTLGPSIAGIVAKQTGTFSGSYLMAAGATGF